MNIDRQQAIALAEYDLHRSGLGWITANGGVHLQVTFEGSVVADYWPTTAKIIFRKGTGFDRNVLFAAIRHGSKFLVAKL